MLAQGGCASISHWLGSSVHWLGSFQNGQKNIEIFSHWLGSFEILPNQCVMLAHNNINNILLLPALMAMEPTNKVSDPMVK